MKDDIKGPNAQMQDEVGGGFIEVSLDFLAYFQMLGLKPSSRVLDIGCGYGRMALALRHHLTSGSYDGFDIMPHHIDWGRQNIASRSPNFRFHHVDLFNSYYNPEGKLNPDTLRFPFPDKSFDFIILTSVFTHVFAPTLKNYLREISRVLAPAGRCFATCFLLNAESRAHVAEGTTARLFNHYQDPETLVADPEKPEGAVAFDEQLFHRWALDASLRPVSTLYGSWAVREQWSEFQDILLLRKSGLVPRVLARAGGALKQAIAAASR